MATLMEQVARFKEWALPYPAEPRFGEWECNYPRWGELHAAVSSFLRERSWETWSAGELAALLYTIARDNEGQQIATWVRELHPTLLIPLATAALENGEPDAKWQLAEALGRLEPRGAEAERLLLLFARDEAEYVRRKALQALARMGSPATEELALAAWHRPDENQPWARMMVLWCLHHVGSARLPALLDEAERDERPHVAAYALRVRSGDVEP